MEAFNKNDKLERAKEKKKKKKKDASYVDAPA